MKLITSGGFAREYRNRGMNPQRSFGEIEYIWIHCWSCGEGFMYELKYRKRTCAVCGALNYRSDIKEA